MPGCDGTTKVLLICVPEIMLQKAAESAYFIIHLEKSLSRPTSKKTYIENINMTLQSYNKMNDIGLPCQRE